MFVLRMWKLKVGNEYFGKILTKEEGIIPEIVNRIRHCPNVDKKVFNQCTFCVITYGSQT